MAGSEGESDIAVTYKFTQTLIQQTRDTILPAGLGSEPSREAARRAAETRQRQSGARAH